MIFIFKFSLHPEINFSLSMCSLLPYSSVTLPTVSPLAGQWRMLSVLDSLFCVTNWRVRDKPQWYLNELVPSAFLVAVQPSVQFFLFAWLESIVYLFVIASLFHSVASPTLVQGILNCFKLVSFAPIALHCIIFLLYFHLRCFSI